MFAGILVALLRDVLEVGRHGKFEQEVLETGLQVVLRQRETLSQDLLTIIALDKRDYLAFGSECLSLELFPQVHMQHLFGYVDVALLRLVQVLGFVFGLGQRVLNPHLDILALEVEQAHVVVFVFLAVLAIHVHVGHLQQEKASKAHILL